MQGHAPTHVQTGPLLGYVVRYVLLIAVAETMLAVLQAMQKRSVGCTLMNEQSSRSHMVFTLRIEGTNASSQLKVRLGRW